MTAAVMSAVLRARAGMAPATTNASREIGGVFGVAPLGAFMSHFNAPGLSSRLGSLAGSAEAKARIASLARRGGQELAGAGFPGVDARQLHAIIGDAFVAGASRLRPSKRPPDPRPGPLLQREERRLHSADRESQGGDEKHY
jgi:hypothetical protein